MKTKRIVLPAFLYLFAAFWTFMTLFPLVLTVMSSLNDNEGILLGMLNFPETLMWSNYAAAIQRANMGRAVLNSILMATASTLVVIMVGMMASYVLSRKQFKLNKFIFALFIIGVMVPIHSTIIPIASLATSIGGRNTYWYITMVYATFNLSQAVFLFTGYLSGIDRELDEAATIDRCTPIELLIRILMPVSKPVIATVAILTFIFGYGELIFAMLLLTDERMFNIARAMLTFQGGYQDQLGPIFASIVIAVTPMIAIYVIFHTKIQSGMLAGAVKG